jgi:hypothetical protein
MASPPAFYRLWRAEQKMRSKKQSKGKGSKNALLCFTALLR